MRTFNLRPGLFAAIAMVTAGTMAHAQYVPPSITTPPAPTYGYTPYNPGNPTGLYHPNDMGYGRYHNPTKLKGYRSPSLTHRHFRGY